MSKAVNLAKVRVDGIASFPADAEEPIVEEIEAATPAIRVSLFGDIEPRKLKELSEQIREEILALGNISEISVLGEQDYEISIELSDEQLRRYGLSFDDVVSAIQAAPGIFPAGSCARTAAPSRCAPRPRPTRAASSSSLTLISRPTARASAWVTSPRCATALRNSPSSAWSTANRR
jgi:multidrug efflux pump subunit AcrB